MMMKRNYRYLLMALLMGGIMLTSCIQDKDEPCPDNQGKVHLSFAIAMPGYGQKANAKSMRGADDVTHGVKAATPEESRINNFWVLMFKKNESDPGASVCEYVARFDLGTNGDINLTGPHPELDNYYQTPVKLMDPGKYILVVAANTVQYVESKDGEMDLITTGSTLEEHKGRTYDSFKGYLNWALWIQDGVDNSDKNLRANRGLPAVKIDEDFVLPPGYYSKSAPYVVKLDLQRPLSKLQVYISNVDELGNPIVNSYSYRLTSIKIKNTAVIYNCGIFNAFRKVQYGSNFTGRRPLVKDIDLMAAAFQPKFDNITLLSGADGFKDQTLPKETLLLSHYMAPWNFENMSPVFDQNTPDAGGNFTHATAVELTFEHKNNHQTQTYTIPLFDKVNPTDAPDHNIKPHTLYELYLTFKGREMDTKLIINAEIKPWVPVDQMPKL